MHTVLNAINIMRREKSLPRQPSVQSGEGVQSGSAAGAPEQPRPNRAIKPELVSALKSSTSRSATSEIRSNGGAAGNLVLTMPDTERKPARVQMRGPHDSAVSSRPAASLGTTRDQGVDPMSTIYLDSSTEVDLSSTKATLGSQTDGAACVTAPITVSAPDSLYLTADDGMPSGTPCASSTRKREETADLSVQATHGSESGAREVEPRDEEAGIISPEQLRFTAAISKAMSEELAPLLAGRDLAQTRPNVYRGSKDGSIDGWILILGSKGT